MLEKNGSKIRRCVASSIPSPVSITSSAANVPPAGAFELESIPFVLEEEVATFLAGILLARYPGLLAERYKFSVQGLDAPGVLEAVARKRGCLLKGRGGELDLEKAAMLLLTDYRSGVLGRISLETPKSREAMLALASAAGVQPESESETKPESER